MSLSDKLSISFFGDYTDNDIIQIPSLFRCLSQKDEIINYQNKTVYSFNYNNKILNIFLCGYCHILSYFLTKNYGFKLIGIYDINKNEDYLIHSISHIPKLDIYIDILGIHYSKNEIINFWNKRLFTNKIYLKEIENNNEFIKNLYYINNIYYFLLGYIYLKKIYSKLHPYYI